jgi:hypothetical protein
VTFNVLTCSSPTLKCAVLTHSLSGADGERERERERESIVSSILPAAAFLETKECVEGTARRACSFKNIFASEWMESLNFNLCSERKCVFACLFAVII